MSEKYEAGYGMIFAAELEVMDKVGLTPEEKAAVLYNFGNLILKTHGYSAGRDMRLTEAGRAMFTMISERFAKNQKNWEKRKPGGAPQGNKNAEKANKAEREKLVKNLAEDGKNPSQISKITGIPRTTVSRILEGCPNKHKESDQTNIKYNIYFKERLFGQGSDEVGYTADQPADGQSGQLECTISSADEKATGSSDEAVKNEILAKALYS